MNEYTITYTNDGNETQHTAKITAKSKTAAYIDFTYKHGTNADILEIGEQSA